ncbi:MAG: hypothetical protein FWF04_05195 [Clostridiales bacterium]|nr:hypothetical protein [Clostridiales bacterium]
MAETTSTAAAETAQAATTEKKTTTEVNNLFNIAMKLLEQESSDEVLEIKKEILRRVALESDIKPSRIPAPLNITEIGGYINLMRELQQEELLRQTLSSILGLPMK